MTAILKANSVVGMCQNCENHGTFEFTVNNIPLNFFSVLRQDPMDPKKQIHRSYQFCRCARCGAGGLVVYKGVLPYATLVEFYPMDFTALPIPKETPKEIESEFREAEKCSGIGAYRAGAAMLRSVLEKTLIGHGYTDDLLKLAKKRVNLESRIDFAAEDGIITVTLKKRAHENIRVLGNNILHDEWRVVTEDEFESSHEYTKRILDCFYDDPEEVKKELEKKGRTVKKNEEEKSVAKIERAFLGTLVEAGKIGSIPSK